MIGVDSLKKIYEKPELVVNKFTYLEDVYAKAIAPSTDPNANGVANGKATLNPMCTNISIITSGF